MTHTKTTLTASARPQAAQDTTTELIRHLTAVEAKLTLNELQVPWHDLRNTTAMDTARALLAKLTA